MATALKTKRKKIVPDDLPGSKLWQFLIGRAKFGGFSAYAPDKPATRTRGKNRRATPKVQLALASYVSVNCVIFGYDANELKVLLLEPQLNGKKYRGAKNPGLSLPGDMVQTHENLDESATRISRDFTGLEHIFLEQLITHGYPNSKKSEDDLDLFPMEAVHRKGHVINIAYFAIINLDDYNAQNNVADRSLKWYPVNSVPGLALNHNQVLEKALETLRFKLKYFPLAFELLPEKFTLRQAQTLYETISGKKLDKRNFRKKLSGQHLLVQLKEKERDVAHKPAFYFRFNFDAYLKQQAEVPASPLF